MSNPHQLQIKWHIVNAKCRSLKDGLLTPWLIIQMKYVRMSHYTFYSRVNMYENFPYTLHQVKHLRIHINDMPTETTSW